MDYKQPGRVVATFGHLHKVVEEHSGGGNRFSLWGPDYSGHYCRMGRYSDLGRAFLSARTITGEQGKQP